MPNMPSHHQQDFWPPRPWWLCFYWVLAYLTFMKAEVLVLPSSCQLSPKPPKILRCLPFFNTDFWHAPKYFVSRQVLTIWTNYNLSLPIVVCDAQTSFSSVYTPRSQQTQKMQMMYKIPTAALQRQRYQQSRERNSSFTAPSRGWPTHYLGLFFLLFNPRNLSFPQNWGVS